MKIEEQVPDLAPSDDMPYIQVFVSWLCYPSFHSIYFPLLFPVSLRIVSREISCFRPRWSSTANIGTGTGLPNPNHNVRKVVSSFCFCGLRVSRWEQRGLCRSTRLQFFQLHSTRWYPSRFRCMLHLANDPQPPQIKLVLNCSRYH